MKTTGEALKAWRARKNLSQVVASQMLDPPTTQGTWAAWETGRKPPSLANALALEVLTGGSIPAKAWVPKHRRPRRRRRRDESGTTLTDGDHARAS